MKPHPRIRTTIKWGGAVVSVVLLVVWIGSGWWMCAFHSTSGLNFSIVGGQLGTQVAVGPTFWNRVALRSCERYNGPWYWWFGPYRILRGWQIFVPLWALVLAAALPTALAWRLDTLARRRAGHCATCGYDRTGLRDAHTTPCPECGTAPTPATPAP